MRLRLISLIPCICLANPNLEHMQQGSYLTKVRKKPYKRFYKLDNEYICIGYTDSKKPPCTSDGQFARGKVCLQLLYMCVYLVRSFQNLYRNIATFQHTSTLASQFYVHSRICNRVYTFRFICKFPS